MRLTKKISEVVAIPEVFEWNPKKEDGTPMLEKPVKYELGGGKIKVFSISPEEIGKIRSRFIIMSIRGGETVQQFDASGFQVAQFVARCGGPDGYWEGFFGPDGNELNCTTENQKAFSWNDGLRVFVCSYVGEMLDNEATGKATDEEKNLLRSLAGTPVGGKGLTPIAGVVRK